MFDNNIIHLPSPYMKFMRSLDKAVASIGFEKSLKYGMESHLPII